MRPDGGHLTPRRWWLSLDFFSWAGLMVVPAGGAIFALVRWLA